MKFSIFIVSFIFLKEIQGISSSNNHFDGLIKYLKKDSKLHQVVFILQEQIIDPIMNSLITTVNSHFPSLSLNHRVFFNKLEERHLRLLMRPRSTTLFILQMTNEENLMEFYTSMKKNELLQDLSLPRCLVVNSNYTTFEDINKTLHSYWLKKFLDITLLTYNNSQVKLKSISDNLPILHYINPFTNDHISKVSKQSEWFPNKLMNLNEYQLNFVIVYGFNSKVTKKGQAIKFIEILAQMMNFKPNITEFYTVNSFYDIYYNYFKSIAKIKPELYIFIESIYYSAILGYSNMRILKHDSLKAVIPKMMKITNNVELSSEFWYMILLTIVMIVFLRITTFFMKFKWQTLNLTLIIMGISISKEPKNWIERIFFASLLITCIAYTSYFYSAILDINLRQIVTTEILNLKELVETDLQPVMDYHLHESSSLTEFGYLLSRKFISFKRIKENECLKQLIDYQNVTCILSNAAYHVNMYEVINGKSKNVKILEEAVAYSNNSFLAKSLSPYIDRFNQLLLRASEFGLVKDFYEPALRTINDKIEPDVITKEKLFLVLFFVLIIGYSLSLIAFIFEIIKAKIKRKFFNMPKFRFVN